MRERNDALVKEVFHKKKQCAWTGKRNPDGERNSRLSTCYSDAPLGRLSIHDCRNLVGGRGFRARAKSHAPA